MHLQLDKSLYFGCIITPFYSVVGIWKSVGFYPPINASIPIDYDKLKEQAMARLDETASHHVDQQFLQPGSVQIATSATHILDTSKDFDLIVISSQGRSGLKRILMGSITEEVLRFSKIPILIVEEKQALIPIKKILLTSDFSDISLAAFPWALDIAKATEAKIELTHVLSFGPFFEANASQMLDRYGPDLIGESDKRLDKLIVEHFHVKLNSTI